MILLSNGVLLAAITETTLMWCKGVTLFFFLGIFLVVLVRVLTRSEAAYAKDASLVLHEESIIEPRVSKSEPSRQTSQQQNQQEKGQSHE